MKMALLILSILASTTAFATHDTQAYTQKVSEMSNRRLVGELLIQTGIIGTSCSTSTAIVMGAAVADLAPGFGVLPDMLAEIFSDGKPLDFEKEDVTWVGKPAGTLISIGLDLVAMGADVLPDGHVADGFAGEDYDKIFKYARESSASTKSLNNSLLGESSLCKRSLNRLELVFQEFKGSN